MFKAFLSIVVGLCFASPANATSWKDVNRLKELVKTTGTDVIARSCEQTGIYGFYSIDEQAGIDQLVICTNTVNMADSDEVWEVISHEATHTMQACMGGPIFSDKFSPRMYRELRAIAPHYYRTLHRYRSSQQRIELEAFWMELQAPDLVIDTFKKSCYTQEENS